MNNLKKVDFFWINRDQKSFEWFVSLLSNLELEMAEAEGFNRFLEMHMYVTSALQRNDMKSVFLQLAMDLNFKKDQRSRSRWLCYVYCISLPGTWLLV